MGGILSQADFLRLVGLNNGDMDKARQIAAENGYSGIEGEEQEDAGAPAGTGSLSALGDILGTQRASIGKLYDDITTNIQKRYRAPDFNDLLVNIGMGMLTPPGDEGEGGFRGALMRGMQGVGKYALDRRSYDQDMNKMMSDVEIGKAKALADLEEKYLTAAGSALKPKSRRTAFNPITGELTDLDTNEVVPPASPAIGAVKVGKNGVRYRFTNATGDGDQYNRANWQEIR